jgi:hypothetical protein
MALPHNKHLQAEMFFYSKWQRMIIQLHHLERARFLGCLRSLAVADALAFVSTLRAVADTAWSTTRSCSAVRNVLPPYTKNGLTQTCRPACTWELWQ